REVPDDAYTGLPAVSRGILFRSRRSRISGVADSTRQDWSLRLLGPMVPGSGAPDGVARGRNYFLSHSDRLAPVGKEGVRRNATCRLGNNPAQSRNREWLLRRSPKPSRP